MLEVAAFFSEQVKKSVFQSVAKQPNTAETGECR